MAQQITGDQSNQKRTSGKPNHQDFTCTKYLDMASAKLIDYCNQAKPIPTVTITVGQNDNGHVTKIWVYVLTNALISSVSVGGGGGDQPQETMHVQLRPSAGLTPSRSRMCRTPVTLRQHGTSPPTQQRKAKER